MQLNPIRKILLALPLNAKVLDLGCMSFRHVTEAKLMGRTDLIHAGVDYVDLSNDLPEGFEFHKCDLSLGPTPFADDSFDLVIGWHIIEHLPNAIEFFGECVRICRPGGLIYLETPSERSLWLPGMPFKHEEFHSLSFYDDPTHVFRPWTPQSFYRLTCYFGCTPLKTGYRTSWKHRLSFPLVIPYALLTRQAGLLERSVWYSLGWASYLLAQKPAAMRGQPTFGYYLA